MKKSMEVGGMSCEHCVKSVTEALSKQPGVSQVMVSLENRKADFEAADEVDVETLKDAVRKIGFEPGAVE